ISRPGIVPAARVPVRIHVSLSAPSQATTAGVPDRTATPTGRPLARPFPASLHVLPRRPGRPSLLQAARTCAYHRVPPAVRQPLCPAVEPAVLQACLPAILLAVL